LPTFSNRNCTQAKVPYPHIHQSLLVGEENQTLECNTTCHAKPDMSSVYEYSMFESVFDNLQPLCLLAYKLGWAICAQLLTWFVSSPQKSLREKCKKGGRSSSANFKLNCPISSWIMEPLSPGPLVKIWPIQLIPLWCAGFYFSLDLRVLFY
jgi:hypothetical protein